MKVEFSTSWFSLFKLRYKKKINDTNSSHVETIELWNQKKHQPIDFESRSLGSQTKEYKTWWPTSTLTCITPCIKKKSLANVFVFYCDAKRSDILWGVQSCWLLLVSLNNNSVKLVGINDHFIWFKPVIDCLTFLSKVRLSSHGIFCCTDSIIHKV